MNFTYSTARVKKGSRALQVKKSASTLGEAALAHTAVASTLMNEDIEDGLALTQEIERYRAVPSKTFTRLDDFFDKLGD